MLRSLSPGRAVAAVLAAALVASAVRASDKPEYNRDVRPILTDNCFACHGPDKNHRKAGLRLDDRAIALKKGAIVPGKPDQSELVARITSTDAKEMMPPPASHKSLTADQKETLKRWIAAGAEYQVHWAYLPLKRPPVPTVKDRAWVRNPVDAFILAALEAKGIKPSPEAEKRTLCRRVSLDLLGLPPTPAEVEAFVNDPSPDAYEKLVDRLLKSPHYGERMAVGWLDLVRYADSVGYHGDQGLRAFPYRDYVIRSFNQNKPFDQFTIEQLAGDLLPHPTPEQLTATAFHRLNMVTREGGAQPKEYLAKYAADRVRTVSMTWLGSTMGCCECHDHKFDPFTQHDFYSLGAFFADVKQWGVYQDYPYTPNPELRGWTNDHPFPPEITVDNPYLKQRKARFQARIRELAAASARRVAADSQSREAFDAWTNYARDFLAAHPTGWLTPPASSATPEAASQADGSFLITGQAKRGGAVTLKLKLPAGWLTTMRLELLPNAKNKGSILRTRNTVTTVSLTADLGGKKLIFAQADADRKDPRWFNGDEILGILGGWRTAAKERRKPQTGTWLLDRPMRVRDGATLTVTVHGNALGCVCVSVSPFGFDDPRHATLDRATFDPAQQYLLSTGWDAAAYKEYKHCRQEMAECRDGRASVVVTVSTKPLTMRVLPRGNWQDQSGPVVQPEVPHFLPQPPEANHRRLTRMDLAKWIVAPENPLTARVFANRLWKQVFGTGLSSTVEDCGTQGEWPVHPELLDWLAVEFRDSGWNVKHLVRLLVTSATYRQSSKVRPELHELDPHNRLLAFLPPRRLEAEFVRDNALAAAGLLNLDVGGPSIKPYQPAGYYSQLQFPDREYQPDTDDRQYRRGVYVWWQRTFLHPMLANFDAPTREECTALRNIANTPQQALTLLNDPEFVEAARVLAAKLLAKPATDAARLDELYVRALARPAKPKERQSLLAFLAEQRTHFRSNPGDAEQLLHVGMTPVPAGADAPELAAWATVCRVVLNLHETITRY